MIGKPSSTSDAVKRIADRYTLGTADKVPKPTSKPKLQEESPLVFPPHAIAWRLQRRNLFKQWAPAALVVAGPRGPVPRGMGDNRLAWPVRIGTTSTFADKQSAIMDSYSPLWWLGAWFRVWVPTAEHCKKLRGLVIEQLPNEPLRHLWVDIGDKPALPGLSDAKVEHDLGLEPLPPGSFDEARDKRRFRVTRRKLELFIHQVAASAEIPTWDDAGVDQQLDLMERQVEVAMRLQMQREVGDVRD